MNNGGTMFERELREQPAVWRAIAASDRAKRLGEAIGTGDVVLLGSGSSLAVAQVGALALRRRGVRAHALAATAVPFDHAAYRNAVVVAISQSGVSSDLLRAIEILAPKRLIGLTNTHASPLADRAGVTIDVGAGPERAIPATKSVSASIALLLCAAGVDGAGCTEALRTAADVIETWLNDDAALDDIRACAERLSRRRTLVVLGSGYGWPIALEIALKFREAAYLSADGFEAGEFRHGSTAMLDASFAMLAMVDAESREIVRRPLEAAAVSESARFALGEDCETLHGLGPRVPLEWASLAWLVTGQLLALHAGRAKGIDSDRPRGLVKIVRS